jgi:DNA-binding transcriptional MerR regulator
MAALTIGKLAAAAGVGVETVRFYQRRGLLAQPERRGSAFREYSEADQRRLAFIRRAQALGFTLTEIRDLLVPAEARSAEARSADDIAAAAAAKLEAVDAQLRELTRLQCRLRRLVRVCEHGSGDDCLALHVGADHPAAGGRTAVRA